MTATDLPQRSAVTRTGALLLLLLTAAALWWPEPAAVRGDGSLLVVMPEPDPRRVDALEALADHLAASSRLDLSLQIVGDRREFTAGLDEALVVFCPDAVAMPLPSAAWQPLVVARRRVPWNLRPSSVLVSRRSAEAVDEPWLSDPARTVFGDSLSLVCLAPLCHGEAAGTLPPGVSWGGDPFDHRAVLEAARHGAFDHAVVRQWDADRAFAAGRLDPAEWRVRSLTGPLPDLVLMASRRLPQGARLDLQEALVVLGRRQETPSGTEERLCARLSVLGLDGFNLLLGPDFDQVRRRYGACWPPAAD